MQNLRGGEKGGRREGEEKQGVCEREKEGEEKQGVCEIGRAHV